MSLGSPVRPDERGTGTSSWAFPSPGLPGWAVLVVGIAVLRTALAFAALLAAAPDEPDSGQLPLPVSVYAALSAVFTVLGIGLVFANRRDRRAAWLGGLFVLIAVPLATPLVHARVHQPLSWLFYVRPDALIGAFVWSFASTFPEELQSGFSRSLTTAIIVATGIIGLLCVLANVLLLWLAPAAGLLGWRSLVIVARGGGPYWALMMGMTLPALIMLFWRAGAPKRRASAQVRLFVRGFIAGLAPITLEIFFEEMWPAYKAWAHSETVSAIIATVIFGALATVPFITAYSVLFDEVVETRFVIRIAVRYALARYTILALTCIPFAGLALYIVEHREAQIVSLLTGPRPAVLGGSVLLGGVMLRRRSVWAEAIDRRYFREPYDSREILTHLVADLMTTDTDELSDRIRREVGRALHARVHVFFADEAQLVVRHDGSELPPLAIDGTLGRLVFATSAPMDVDLTSPASPLRRLPQDEQAWLRQEAAALLVAIRSRNLEKLGVLTLGTKQSGLPYSAEDRAFLSSVASATALALENVRLRSLQGVPPDPLAGECVTCGRVTDFGAVLCACGGKLTVASIPHVLRGVFRFEQRIGEGGMGRVYRAVDLNLHREVAIKTLPKMSPDASARLRREARAMAAVTHPNLAAIYGMETWQGTPLLVQEYLEGGTLAARIARGRLNVVETLDLGITLARLLEYLHASGIIHCDIKPGNIGFTRDAVVKLLDFGIARVLKDVYTTGRLGLDGTRSTQPPTGGAIAGTPQFMSPEAARGEEPAPSFDLWALAVVLFESLSARRPFHGDVPSAVLAGISSKGAPDIREAQPDVPAQVAEFFRHAFASDPAARPGSAAALAAELLQLRANIQKS